MRGEDRWAPIATKLTSSSPCQCQDAPASLPRREWPWCDINRICGLMPLPRMVSDQRTTAAVPVYPLPPTRSPTTNAECGSRENGRGGERRVRTPVPVKNGANRLPIDCHIACFSPTALHHDENHRNRFGPPICSIASHRPQIAVIRSIRCPWDRRLQRLQGRWSRCHRPRTLSRDWDRPSHET